MKPAPALLLRGVTRHRGRGEQRVLANDGVDLEVRAGEVVGLLGPNGAGKTTCVRQVVGLLKPEAGAIEILGHDAVADPSVAARAAAYLAQDETALLDQPVALALETTGRLRGLTRKQARQHRDDVLAELGLTPLADRPLVKLSGGQRRLAALGAALVGERPLLVLDEPTTGLDPEARRAAWAAVDRRRSRNGAAVLLVTHNVLEAETVLDRVAILDRGRVVAFDTPGRLKASVSDEVRLDLVWHEAAPLDDPVVRAAGERAEVRGRRWTLHLPADEARPLLAHMTTGPVLAALDDFSLATPTLEDVYLALGGKSRDWAEAA